MHGAEEKQGEEGEEETNTITVKLSLKLNVIVWRFRRSHECHVNIGVSSN